MNHLHCLGINHQTASIQVRENLDLGASDLVNTFQNANGSLAVDEIVILSTCNRYELYLVASSPDSRPLPELFSRATGMPLSLLQQHTYHLQDSAAARHLHQVACGLDSLVLGEPQILGQVADAYRKATESGSAGMELVAVFQSALRAGKRARSETRISRHAMSVSAVAVQLATQICGNINDSQVLLVGAGEMAQLALKALLARGVRNIAIANRTTERAANLVQYLDAPIHSLDRLPELLSKSDVVFTAARTTVPLIPASMVEQALRVAPNKPLVLVDIALPRNIEPAAANLEGVSLYNLDNLRHEMDLGYQDRLAQVPAVRAIIDQEIEEWDRWRRRAEVRPTIRALRKQAEAIRNLETERALRSLPDLDDSSRRRLDAMTRALVNKLLHEPTLRLRQEAEQGQAAAYADAVRYLFDLPEEEQTTDE